MESRKIVPMILRAEQQRRHRHKEHSREKENGMIKQSIETYTLPYVK